ncbi:conserved phage C-terminal domain-containing protein [Lactobacillus sp. IBH004]|uniref:conserved phage C-terminal domain-containing protein n=1 Tax=Lactobacillus sp. IBH004 TaxID=2879107 RepID=UPI002244D726|nr:conserved phage C-terminal domain-containing protein [Lactobacillus sp. IBH004]UZN41867.1 conserved phage C-terminal domain-containing protein [Lactobacillus sp. IBH004]
MVRLIKKDNGNYTNTNNQLVRDDDLTWKARGIFNYLWSQANEWQFYVKEIASHSKDGEKALQSGLQELEEHGYLKRVNRHSKNGSFDGLDWILDDTGRLNRQTQNSVNGKMSTKPPKNRQNTPDVKRAQRETRPAQNLPLSNNNSKNYQYKEISNKRNNGSAKAEPSSIHQDVIDYLNEKLGARYKASSAINKRLIDARVKEGYKLDDFKQVIDNKVASWANDTKMSKYLRPQTLFGTKFESYLNERAPNVPAHAEFGEEAYANGTMDGVDEDDLPF